MFKRLPEAATTPVRTSKHHLHQWFVDASTTTVRAARRTWLPALGLALIVSTTLLGCGSDETQQQPGSDGPASAQEATEPASASTPTVSSGTQPTPDGNDGRSTLAARETRETVSPTDEPTPTPVPTNTPEPTPTPTPVPTLHHEFAPFMAPINEDDELVHRMPEDGTDNPIYPFNGIRTIEGFLVDYPQYDRQSLHLGGELEHPELTQVILTKAMNPIIDATSDEIRKQITPEEQAAGVPTDNNVFMHHLHEQAYDRAEWQLVTSTPEELTISVMTYFAYPWRELRYGEEPTVQFRIASDVVFKVIDPAGSQYGAIYRLKEEHDRAPEFSHLAGEPTVEKQ